MQISIDKIASEARATKGDKALNYFSVKPETYSRQARIETAWRNLRYFPDACNQYCDCDSPHGCK
jgi:hypothetical protein